MAITGNIAKSHRIGLDMAVSEPRKSTGSWVARLVAPTRPNEQTAPRRRRRPRPATCGAQDAEDLDRQEEQPGVQHGGGQGHRGAEAEDEAGRQAEGDHRHGRTGRPSLDEVEQEGPHAVVEDGQGLLGQNGAQAADQHDDQRLPELEVDCALRSVHEDTLLRWEPAG
jgi:hypothetical protein